MLKPARTEIEEKIILKMETSVPSTSELRPVHGPTLKSSSRPHLQQQKLETILSLSSLFLSGETYSADSKITMHKLRKLNSIDKALLWAAKMFE